MRARCKRSSQSWRNMRLKRGVASRQKTMSRWTDRFPRSSGLLRRMRAGAVALALCAGCTAAYAQRSEPRSLPVPSKDASYVLPDGSIYFAGNDLVDVYFQKLNALFIKAHPGFKFKTDMQD